MREPGLRPTWGMDARNPPAADAHDVVTYAHYACVADCANAMADAWEDTAGCAQAICLHENLLK